MMIVILGCGCVFSSVATSSHDTPISIYSEQQGGSPASHDRQHATPKRHENGGTCPQRNSIAVSLAVSLLSCEDAAAYLRLTKRGEVRKPTRSQ